MNMIKVGPVGGRTGGQIWDEKGDELVGIFVSYDEDIVNSLQFMNNVDGKLDMSAKHGTQHCEIYSALIFDYPSEFLTSISGSFQIINKKLTILRSIKFGTNNGSYGPFGTPTTDGNKIDFNFVIGNHQFFGGFHGTKNRGHDGIESIGFYVKDIPSSVIKLKDIPAKALKKEKEEE